MCVAGQDDDGIAAEKEVPGPGLPKGMPLGNVIERSPMGTNDDRAAEAVGKPEIYGISH